MRCGTSHGCRQWRRCLKIWMETKITLYSLHSIFGLQPCPMVAAFRSLKLLESSKKKAAVSVALRTSI